MDDYIVKPVTLDRLAVAPAKCWPLATATVPEAAAALPVEEQRIAAGAALHRHMLDQLREDLGGTAALRDLPSTRASYWRRAGVESARRRWSTRCNERTGFSLRRRAQTECVRDSAPFQLANDPFDFLSGGLISSMLYIILLNDAHNREAGGS
jgi:hypothetical protein